MQSRSTMWYSSSLVASTMLLLGFALASLATPVIYDGRASLSLTEADLNESTDPYLTVVKGSQNASHYDTLLGLSTPPTPLWSLDPTFLFSSALEQSIAILIDNSSIFVPGSGGPQNGFRRTELLAQKDNNHTALIPLMENGTTTFHFSIRMDESRPLNYSHEYQIVFIEPNDGSHVFEVQLGSPFTDPTAATLPVPQAHSFKIRDHALNVLFTTPFTASTWHNFAVQVDWDNRTLVVLYSTNDSPLKAVTGLEQNPTTALGADGQGDFHFGVLKLPLVNPSDDATDQADVAHFGIQEGTIEALIYSGVFVESVEGGISLGYGLTRPRISS